MIDIDIPGFCQIHLTHLVLDYNGTLAVDGKLISGVGKALTAIAKNLQIHVITADTFGLAKAQLAGLPVQLTVFPVEGQDKAKLDYITRLGVDSVIAIGNGRNDRKMLKSAAVGIALIQKESCASEAMASADIISTNIIDALDLLRNPKRMVATLRS